MFGYICIHMWLAPMILFVLSFSNLVLENLPDGTSSGPIGD